MTGKSKLPWYRLWKKEVVDGISITWVACTPSLRFGVPGKILCYLSFFFLALPMILTTSGDILITTSPPPSVSFLGLLLHKFKNIPWVLEVRDLWPEMIQDLGVKIGVFSRISNKIACDLYKNSSSIIALTPGFAKIIAQKGISSEKISVIPNGVDPIFEDQPQNQISTSFNENKKFCVLYLGSMGTANRLTTLLSLAERLIDYPDIQFVFIGDGTEKNKLMREAAEKKLTNVLFQNSVPRQSVPEVLKQADLCILTHAQQGSFHAFIPNRLFDYLASGKPVLAVLEKGDASEILEKSGGGTQISAKDLDAAAKAILDLRIDPEKRRKMGASGQKYAFEKFLRKNLAEKYFKILERVKR